MNIDTSFLPESVLQATAIVLFIALMAGTVNTFLKGTSETVGIFKKKSATQSVITELQQALDVSSKLGETDYQTHKKDVDRYINEVLSARLFQEIRLAERELDGNLYSSLLRLTYRTINRPIFIIIYALAWAWWISNDSQWSLQSLINRNIEGIFLSLAAVAGILLFASISAIAWFLINKDLDRADRLRKMRQSAVATGSVAPSLSHLRDIPVDRSVTVYPSNAAAKGEGGHSSSSPNS